jgi:hypothetical protein
MLEAPPQQFESWWTALVFGSDSAPVNPLDARIAIQHVAYRLGQQMPLEAAMGFPSTVGEPHTTIEECYGKPGWTAFVQCWQQAACIGIPIAKHAGSAGSVVFVAQSAQNVLVANHNRNSDPGSPIDPGLLVTLPQMPRRLANWMLRSPGTAVANGDGWSAGAARRTRLNWRLARVALRNVRP